MIQKIKVINRFLAWIQNYITLENKYQKALANTSIVKSMSKKQYNNE